MARLQRAEYHSEALENQSILSFLFCVLRSTCRRAGIRNKSGGRKLKTRCLLGLRAGGQSTSCSCHPTRRGTSQLRPQYANAPQGLQSLSPPRAENHERASHANLRLPNGSGELTSTSWSSVPGDSETPQTAVFQERADAGADTTRCRHHRERQSARLARESSAFHGVIGKRQILPWRFESGVERERRASRQLSNCRSTYGRIPP
jgi:hypothetical protein